MTIEWLAQSFTDNGIWILFVLVGLEYVGIPGYPGGFTLPAIGVLCRSRLLSLGSGIAVALAASSIMIVAVYLVGLLCGDWARAKLARGEKFAKGQQQLSALIEKYGSPAVLIARLIPFARVFVSITAGLLGMEWKRYCIYSFIGNTIYLVCAVLLGYGATAIFI